jgi:hypothetical protein
MKDDENCVYYAIISQPIPKVYGGDVLGPQSEIPDDVKK